MRFGLAPSWLACARPATPDHHARPRPPEEGGQGGGRGLTFTQAGPRARDAGRRGARLRCRDGVVGLLRKPTTKGQPHDHHRHPHEPLRRRLRRLPRLGPRRARACSPRARAASGRPATRRRVPRAPARPGPAAKNAEPGYYVRPPTARGVMVVESKRATRTAPTARCSPSRADGSRPSWDYVPGAGYSVADLRPMTAADAAEMGLAPRLLHHLLRPARRRDASRAAVTALIGYGETCAEHLRLALPEGRQGPARRYLAEHGSDGPLVARAAGGPGCRGTSPPAAPGTPAPVDCPRCA